jgi:hypothetical protein
MRLSGGFACREMLDAGYAVSELRSGGYTLSDMKEANVSAIDAREAGFTLQEMKGGSSSVLFRVRSAVYSVAELQSAGFSGGEIESGVALPVQAVPVS